MTSHRYYFADANSAIACFRAEGARRGWIGDCRPSSNTANQLRGSWAAAGGSAPTSWRTDVGAVNRRRSTVLSACIVVSVTCATITTSCCWCCWCCCCWMWRRRVRPSSLFVLCVFCRLTLVYSLNCFILLAKRTFLGSAATVYTGELGNFTTIWRKICGDAACHKWVLKYKLCMTIVQFVRVLGPDLQRILC